MTIDFKPTHRQFEAWGYLTDSQTTDIGYGGSAGGGKSYLGCFWLLSMCLAHPKSGWLMGRKELVNLKRTTLTTFFKVCENFKIDPSIFSYNQQTNVITFTNGSQIFLFDLSYQPSDPLYTRLGSLELTGGFVDESNEIDAQAITIVKTRCGRRMNTEYGLKPKILETFNPDKGHVYFDYYLPWKKGEMPAHRRFIQALATDNPYVSEDYIEQLRKADNITRERLLNGNFDYDDDPNALMVYDAICDIFTNTVETDGRFITADIARFGDDKTEIGYWEGFHLKEVQTLSHEPLDVVAQKISRMAADKKVPFSCICVDEAGVGGGVVDMLKGIKGFIGGSSPLPNPVTGQADNFLNLRAQCFFKLAEMVNKHGIRVDAPSADFREKLIQELQQVKEKDRDKDGKRRIIPKDEIKKNIGRSPDISDMISLRMYFLYRTQTTAQPIVQHFPNYQKQNYGQRRANTYAPE